jgi:hypothetical protein
LLKKILFPIGDSFKKYFLNTVVKSLLFRNGVFNGLFNGVFFWGMLFAIIVSDTLLTINQNQNIAISITAGAVVVLFFLAAGYILFLVFDYIPMQAIIKRILPIREKLDEIMTNSEITKHSFTEPYEIENIDKIIKLERMPKDKVLEVWLYKLKVQRNFYIILAPLFYLMITIVSMMLQNTHVTWINNIYDYISDLVKSPPAIVQLLKWAFIAFVVTNETANINIDISRVELLKGLSKR